MDIKDAALSLRKQLMPLERPEDGNVGYNPQTNTILIVVRTDKASWAEQHVDIWEGYSCAWRYNVPTPII
ncbi:MAG TPA: hypothetical protein VEP90_18115 [Methylomirabilota bacterium]|nr:hypothetical protein [Methylomirabilota bacterium]